MVTVHFVVDNVLSVELLQCSWLSQHLVVFVVEAVDFVVVREKVVLLHLSMPVTDGDRFVTDV